MGVLAANIATFVTARYRISAIVPLSVLGAIGLKFVIDRFFRRPPSGPRFHHITRDIVVPGLLVGWIAFSPVVSEDELILARRTATANLKRSERAEELKHRLSRINHRSSLTQDERKERAFLLLRLQRLTEAFQEFQTLSTEMPNDPQILRQLLAMTIVDGDYEAAAVITQEAHRRFGWGNPEIIERQEISVRAILTRFILTDP
jgi:hypothetical protein